MSGGHLHLLLLPPLVKPSPWKADVGGSVSGGMGPVRPSRCRRRPDRRRRCGGPAADRPRGLCATLAPIHDLVTRVASAHAAHRQADLPTWSHLTGARTDSLVPGGRAGGRAARPRLRRRCGWSPARRPAGVVVALTAPPFPRTPRSSLRHAHSVLPRPTGAAVRCRRLVGGAAGASACCRTADQAVGAADGRRRCVA